MATSAQQGRHLQCVSFANVLTLSGVLKHAIQSLNQHQRPPLPPSASPSPALCLVCHPRKPAKTHPRKTLRSLCEMQLKQSGWPVYKRTGQLARLTRPSSHKGPKWTRASSLFKPPQRQFLQVAATRRSAGACATACLNRATSSGSRLAAATRPASA